MAGKLQVVQIYKYSLNNSAYYMRVIDLFIFGRSAQHAGSQFPHQGLNPRPLQWKSGVLTTGPPRKSLYVCYFILVCSKAFTLE